MDGRDRITILYEDQRGPTRGFGLHALVKACVLDRIGRINRIGRAGDDRRAIEEALADHRPMKGVEKVLAACRDDIEDIACDGRSVIAVFDDDAIRRCLKLPAGAPAARVEQHIRKGCKAPDALTIVLLQRNAESVLQAIRDCAPGLDAARLDRAIRQKDLLARDAVFAAVSRDAMRPTRDCILARVPSLEALVRVLCDKLTRRRPRRRKAGRA